MTPSEQDRDDVVRVAAVDNHPVVLAGVKAALESSDSRVRLVAVACSVDELLEGPGSDADVVLLDLWMDRPEGVEPADDVRRLLKHGAAVIIFTSDHRPVPVRAAVEAGASGLVLKVDPVETLVQAVEDVAAGDLACSGPLAHALLTDPELAGHLTERQVELMQLVADGLTYRAIARRASVTESTVREHLNRAVASYRSRGIPVPNSHALVSLARSEGHLTG